MKYLMLSPLCVLFVIGAMMALRMVPPNAHTGYRTARTLSDEAIWYTVNANVGWSLVLTSALGALLVWRVFATDLHLTIKSLTSTAALICVAVVAVVVGTIS